MNRGPTPPKPRYRGRFAPSPTGPLHFGSLVAAVVSYCDARAAGGEWLVRIEDVDLPRARGDAESLILTALERYGFAWDGEIVRQSERTVLYDEALARLAADDQVYPCACARRELETAPRGVGGDRVYPGTCRDGIPAVRAWRSQRAWRVRVGEATVEFRDRLQGTQSQALTRDVGDFVVKRGDGLYAYQLAVVVDDAQQGITDIVRGADLLASTARQIHLQRLLGYPTPSYLHAPVAIGAGGEKLSKQTLAPALPDDALPVLLAAWRFLQQPVPQGSATPCSIDEFWRWASASYKPSLLPPTAMLPAPARFECAVAGKV